MEIEWQGSGLRLELIVTFELPDMIGAFMFIQQHFYL